MTHDEARTPPQIGGTQPELNYLLQRKVDPDPALQGEAWGDAGSFPSYDAAVQAVEQAPGEYRVYVGEDKLDDGSFDVFRQSGGFVVKPAEPQVEQV